MLLFLLFSYRRARNNDNDDVNDDLNNDNNPMYASQTC